MPLGEFAGSKVAHALYLPPTWTNSSRAKLPMIVEFSGNGIVPADSNWTVNGWGLSQGKGYIWLVLPFVSAFRGSATCNQRNWFGCDPSACDLYNGPAFDRICGHNTTADSHFNPAPTVSYATQAVRMVMQKYNVDPARVLLTGHSRGALAVNYIGLHNDQIAALWTAFAPTSHYDGVKSWGYPGSDRTSALARLRRVGGRPVFIAAECNLWTFAREYLQHTGVSLKNFRIMPTELKDHNPWWSLRPDPGGARAALRSWLKTALPPHESDDDQWRTRAQAPSRGSRLKTDDDATAGTAAPPGNLTCVGRLSRPGKPDIFVWEDLRGRAGPISFFAADNATLLEKVAKRDVDAGQAEATTDGSNASCCGHGFTLEQLTSAGPDLLGKALLAAAGADDPDEAAVAAALPPFIAGRQQVAAFVGSRKGPAYPLTRSGEPAMQVGFSHPWGWPGGPIAGPQIGNNQFGNRLVCTNPATAGVVGGYMPILRWTFNETHACGAGSHPTGCCPDVDDSVVFDVTVLGELDPPSAVHQSVWWRYL
jgi:hypothetical protein